MSVTFDLLDFEVFLPRFHYMNTVAYVILTQTFARRNVSNAVRYS